jgi:hypothetical protein
MPECDLGQIQNFAARNDAKIVMAITLQRMKADPWATILESGTWIGNEADTHTVVVGRNAAPANPTDTVIPEFTDVAQSCGQFPAPDLVGSTEFHFKLKRHKGVGPLVCLYQGVDAFEQSYDMAAKSLANLVTMKINGDNRNIVLQLSGMKAVVNNTVNFVDTLNGNAYLVAQPFKPGLTPNTVPTFAYIKKLSQFMTTELNVPEFTADTGRSGSPIPANTKVIAGEEILEQFRNEIGVTESTGFLTAGGFKIGEKQVLSYVWEGPVRGVGFAKDPQPIRLATWPANGVITAANVVPPELPANLHNGTGNVPNPLYWTAPYEILFLVAGKGAFVREVLKGSGTITLGNSSFKFPDQYTAGQLKFFVPQGACDAFGEHGFHTYQILRAIRPQHPHFIVPVGFNRCLNITLPYCVGNQL